MNVPEEIPSLYKMTVMKLSFHFWNSKDIATFIGEVLGSKPLNDELDDETWLTVQREVDEKVDQLPIEVVALKYDVANKARFMGCQLRTWIRDISCATGSEIFKFDKFPYYIENYFEIYPELEWYKNETVSPDGRYIYLISWTASGTIDLDKTTRKLIDVLSSNPKGLATSFFLACFYCMDDVIHSLWAGMDMDERNRQYETVDGNVRNFECYGLLRFWIRYLRGHDFDPFHGYIAAESPKCKTIVAANFFWEKVHDPNDKEFTLLTIYPQPMDLRLSICPVLFMALDPEHQFSLLQRYPWLVIKSFVYWGCVGTLPTLINDTRLKILIPSSFYFILIEIAKQSYYCFEVFWSKGSDVQRNFVVSSLLRPTPIRNPWEDGTLFLQHLFKLGHKIAIKLIFQNLDADQRMEIMKNNRRDVFICIELIRDHKWELLNFFGKEFVFSKDAMENLRKELLKEFSFSYAVELDKFFAYVSSLLINKPESDGYKEVQEQTKDSLDIISG